MSASQTATERQQAHFAMTDFVRPDDAAWIPAQLINGWTGNVEFRRRASGAYELRGTAEGGEEGKPQINVRNELEPGVVWTGFGHATQRLETFENGDILIEYVEQ